MSLNNQIEQIITNPLYDGVIISKEKLDLSWDYLSYQNFSHYKCVEDFIKNKSDKNSIIIINADNCTQIDFVKSNWLFNKIRGKSKVILYNASSKTLDNSDFYEYIKWMRLIKF
jgi:hypothetical protein